MATQLDRVIEESSKNFDGISAETEDVLIGSDDNDNSNKQTTTQKQIDNNNSKVTESKLNQIIIADEKEEEQNKNKIKIENDEPTNQSEDSIENQTNDNESIANKPEQPKIVIDNTSNCANTKTKTKKTTTKEDIQSDFIVSLLQNFFYF
jgi:TolA-binding protein